MVTTSSLSLLFLVVILGLISQQQLLPGIVVLGSFILFVLFLTGLVETSIQLYGPSGGVNTYCGSHPRGFDSDATRVWLANVSLCEFIIPFLPLCPLLCCARFAESPPPLFFFSRERKFVNRRLTCMVVGKQARTGGSRSRF